MSTDASWVQEMPSVYERVLGPALFSPMAEQVGRRVAGLAPHRVLELAAGTGQLTRVLVRLLPDAEVLATDLNEAMVAWGAEHVPGATWQQADAQDLAAVAADSVDVVVCQFGAMFFPDRVGAFAQARRVLVPGGALVVVVWDAVERSTLPAALVRALGQVLPEDPPDFVVRVPYGLADPAVVQAELEAAGLQVQEVSPLQARGCSSSAAEAAHGFCLGSPLRFALQARGDLATLTAAVAERMTALLGEGPVEGDLAAHLLLARRA